jgi:hypothetical protein
MKAREICTLIVLSNKLLQQGMWKIAMAVNQEDTYETFYVCDFRFSRQGV